MAIQYTHKTREGRPARIVCTDMQSSKTPVIALIKRGDGKEDPILLSSELQASGTGKEPFLIEKSIWEDVAVDTPVWVRHAYSRSFFQAHFAKYENGCVYIWDSGRTSHTTAAWASNSEAALTTHYHPSRVFLEKPE